MGTYLTNDKMSPELRARIEASVRAGRPASGGRAARRARVMLRLVALVVIGASAIALGVRWHYDGAQLEAARRQLVEEYARAVGPLQVPATERIVASRELLVRAAGLYEGDLVAPVARGRAALDRLLSRPALYVRGPIESLRSRELLPAAVDESVKDAFVACLLAPPSSTEEPELVHTVAAAYRGSLPTAVEHARVYRLQDLLAAEGVLSARWRDRVDAAGSVGELGELRGELDRAKLGQAAQAAQAELLIYVLDEPKKPGTLEEVDGACDHMVRVGIVDLGGSKALLRLRRRVEPSWISQSRRVAYARGLNGCRLAVEVRQAVDTDRAAARP